MYVCACACNTVSITFWGGRSPPSVTPISAVDSRPTSPGPTSVKLPVTLNSAHHVRSGNSACAEWRLTVCGVATHRVRSGDSPCAEWRLTVCEVATHRVRSGDSPCADDSPCAEWRLTMCGVTTHHVRSGDDAGESHYDRQFCPVVDLGDEFDELLVVVVGTRLRRRLALSALLQDLGEHLREGGPTLLVVIVAQTCAGSVQSVW